jgi:hypothetical protein
MVTKTETAFLVVGFFIIVLAMASFAIDTGDQGTDNVQKTMDAGIAGSTQTYEYIHKTVPIRTTNNALDIDIDPEQELEYLYVKVQSIHADITQIEQHQEANEPVPGNLNSITADINDVREHLLDLIGLVDDVELEQLSEELNNAKSRLEAMN